MRGFPGLWVTFTILVALGGRGAFAPAEAQKATARFADVQDTLSNPIVLGCGDRVDPVGFVLFHGRGLALTSDQTRALAKLVAKVRERNLPLAVAWRSSHDRESLAGLRDSYRRAVEEIEALLTPEQWDAALAPSFPQTVGDGAPRQGVVRCFFRSHLVIVR